MTNSALKKEIRSITDQLIEKYKPEKIFLFGSAVSGKFTSDSDLDFLIVKRKVPKYGYQRMQQVRKLIKKKLPADFLVYRSDEFENLTRLREPFLTSILKEGRILYG